MGTPVNWRHWLAACVLLAVLAWAGWSYLSRPARVTAHPAPPGAAPRMRDAPEPGRPAAEAPAAPAPGP